MCEENFNEIFDYSNCEKNFDNSKTPDYIRKSLMNAKEMKETARINYWKKICPKDFSDLNDQPEEKKPEIDWAKRALEIREMIIPKKKNDKNLFEKSFEEDDYRPRKNSL